MSHNQFNELTWPHLYQPLTSAQVDLLGELCAYRIGGNDEYWLLASVPRELLLKIHGLIGRLHNGRILISGMEYSAVTPDDSLDAVIEFRRQPALHHLN